LFLGSLQPLIYVASSDATTTDSGYATTNSGYDDYRFQLSRLQISAMTTTDSGCYPQAFERVTISYGLLSCFSRLQIPAIGRFPPQRLQIPAIRDLSIDYKFRLWPFAGAFQGLHPETKSRWTDFFGYRLQIPAIRDLSIDYRFRLWLVAIFFACLDRETHPV
jgi:hypothetical protein